MAVHVAVVSWGPKMSRNAPPGHEQDAIILARVIALVCVIAIVGTIRLVIFLQTDPPRAIFIKNGTHRNTL